MTSRIASRIIAVTGFPGRRRFTATSLRRLLAGANMDITREEMLPGVIPIGFIVGVLRA